MVDGRRFHEGAVVVGRGWFVRLGRLRLLWAPPPDPNVTRVVLDDLQTVRLTVSWTDNLVTEKSPDA